MKLTQCFPERSVLHMEQTILKCNFFISNKMKKLFFIPFIIAGLLIVTPISAAKISAVRVGSKINVTPHV